MSDIKILKTENLPKPFDKMQFSNSLLDYVNHTLTVDEQKIYEVFFNAIKSRNDITEPQDLLLLDSVVHNFIRMKRLQILNHEVGDTYQFVMKDGSVSQKAHDHANLLNAVEAQFRNTMKELGLSRKDTVKKQTKSAKNDFASFLSGAKVVEMEESKDGTRRAKVEK